MHIARQLGRYHLLDRIAVGGMAEIYRAKTFDSQGIEHLVAIKRVLGHLAEDDDLLQMLVDEAKIATLLDHPNIAKVYEFVRSGEEYFIAMEYVDGPDLRSLLDRSKSLDVELPIEHAAYVIMRSLEALEEAHSKTDGAGQALNIVHRDISPSNVIVSYEGQVKLCDFGIAKAKLSRVQTRVGVIKGKVKYMSPEQAMGHSLDGRSDLFSCGSVLYELLTAQPPFTADNEMALIFRVRDAKATKPSRVNPKIPSELEKIVRKMMNRSLGGRYATANEAAVALRQFLQGFAPDYTPSKLGRFLRKLYAADIERDLRKLEEFVIERGDPNAMGFNLLAEVLGEGAPYTRFSPMPLLTALREQQEEAIETRLMPRMPAPEYRLPADVDLHDLKTEILDEEEREGRFLKRKHRKRPGADHHHNRMRETQAGTGVYDLRFQPPDPDASTQPKQAPQPMLGQPAGAPPPPLGPPPALGQPAGPPPSAPPAPAPEDQSTIDEGPETQPGGLEERQTAPRHDTSMVVEVPHDPPPLPPPPLEGAPYEGAAFNAPPADTDVHGMDTDVFDLPQHAPRPPSDDDDRSR
jgi:serine/threonine protein kinase